MTTTHQNTRRPQPATLVAAAALILTAAGCQSGRATSRSPGIGAEPAYPSPNSLSSALREAKSPPISPIATIDGQSAPAASVPAWAQNNSVDVQSLLDRMAAEAAAIPPAEPAPVLAAAEQPPAPEITAPKAAEPGLPPAPPPEVPPKPFEQRLEEASLTLSDLILQQAGEGYSPALPAWRTYLGLAGLEVIRPGSFPQMITPRGIGASGLSDRDYAAAVAVRDFLSAAAALTGDAGPGSLADGVADLAQKLDARPMRIQAAELCSRVTGYGQYTSLGTRRFLQGKPLRAIIYVEVARFANKPVDGGRGLPELTGPGPKGGYAVELSQTLELYHDSDGLLTWRKPEETVLETSRNPRRDFFLIQDVTLPATLSNGAYRLKVTIRDRATGQEDQAIIPIEIVSDPALAYQRAPGSPD